jgi:hypothetical protein
MTKLIIHLERDDYDYYEDESEFARMINGNFLLINQFKYLSYFLVSDFKRITLITGSNIIHYSNKCVLNYRPANEYDWILPGRYSLRLQNRGIYKTLSWIMMNG